MEVVGVVQAANGLVKVRTLTEATDGGAVTLTVGVYDLTWMGVAVTAGVLALAAASAWAFL